MSQSKKEAIVVVSGVKFTKARRRFDHKKDVRYFELADGTYKMNAAAGSILKLHEEYEIIAQGNNPEEAARLEELGIGSTDRYFAGSMLDKANVKKFIAEVIKLKQSVGLPVYLVHCGSAPESYAVDAACNVREIVLIPYGQYPQLGA